MIDKIKFWLNNSRPFSLPMTFLPWLCVFIYSLKSGGNYLNGIIALTGILFAHLATNLIDDYVDYGMLKGDAGYKTKFKYLVDGTSSISELRNVIIVYLTIAFSTGLYLFYKCGIMVILLAIAGGSIVLSYPRLSSKGLGEIAVGIAFGPLLFEGVFYVMNGYFSLSALILSFSVVSFVVILLFVNNFLDCESDIKNNKITLCVRLGMNNAIKFLYILGGCGYFLAFIFGYLENLPAWLVVFTLPLLFSLGQSLKNYAKDKNIIPKVKWWNYPLENWDKLCSNRTAPFYFNLLTARNLAVWFSLLISLSLII